MAELTINERESDDAVILDLNGDITFGKGNIILRAAIRRLIGEGKNKIRLNLEKVCYIDSSGIGELISGLTAVSREDDGELKLLNPTERIQTLLEIAHLTKVFDIQHDECKAPVS
jgi:anti-sigma B factor antagonist